mgnify:FL=1|jgi:hypothetical protein
MKLITFLILINFMNSQAIEIHNSIYKDTLGSYSKSILHKSTDKKTDKDLLISIILHSKWSDFNSIIEMSKNELKQLLVTELSKRTNETSYDLYNKTIVELSSFCLLYTFLETAYIRTESELKDMSIANLRNSLIIENTKNLELNIPTLQTLTTKKLVQLGHSWYLPKKYNSLINFDNSSSLIRSKFKLKDDLERPMNVIKIVETNEDTLNSFLYLGVYHVTISEDNFNLQLAGSNDLFNWRFITEIDHNAHQGDIVKWNDGYLIAYEEDKIQGANNIALKYYANYDHLISNHYTFEKHLNTSIHNFRVEGTPDIRHFTGENPTNGSILIGFHYHDGTVDKLAMGVLKNGNNWTTWKDSLAEGNLRDMSFKGNIGSRKGFKYHGELLTLQEARFIKNDWSSWKIMLGLNGYYTEVLISTPKKSTSFANPSITKINNNKYVISLFVPTEGNHYNENNGGFIFLKNK